MALLLDTGVLYALADRDDAWHKRCRRLLASANDLLLVPVTVLPEVCYLLHARLGPLAERRFLASVAAGELAVEDLGDSDTRRCVEILERYPAIGFVDASIVAMAERLGLSTIATTDRRHFGALRPRHVAAFRLVPE
jgi:predicted nucleic acid-binding protein